MNINNQAIDNLSLSYAKVYENSHNKISKLSLHKQLKNLEMAIAKIEKRISPKTKKVSIISLNLAKEYFVKAKFSYQEQEYSYCQIFIDVAGLYLSEVR